MSSRESIHHKCATATFEPELAPGAFDQDAAHRLRRRAQEMSAALPRGLVLTAEAKPGLVHQSGRLQGLAWRFVGNFRRRESAQFIIDQWKKFFGCVGIALFDRMQNAREIAHPHYGSKSGKICRGQIDSNQYRSTACACDGTRSPPTAATR